MNKSFLTKKTIGTTLIAYEIIGFIFVIISDWIVMLFDPPYFQFNTSFRTVEIHETIFETFIHIILCLVVVYWTMKLIKKIRYLEGFMIICASCKHVKVKDDWIQIEKVISDNSNLQFSHGICPDCAKKLYGEFLTD
jgi:hypothetical protein